MFPQASSIPQNCPNLFSFQQNFLDSFTNPHTTSTAVPQGVGLVQAPALSLHPQACSIQEQHQHAGQQITMDYLLVSSVANKKPKGTVIMPHHFITTGDGSKPIEQGQATWSQYFATLMRLAAHPAFPPTAQAALYKHEEDLAVMAIS